MILVSLIDGECIEVETADAVRKAEGSLICVNQEGREMARFPLREVQVFTADKQMAEEILDEGCEDLAVVEAPQDEKSRASGQSKSSRE